jgi:hypothetical protein
MSHMLTIVAIIELVFVLGVSIYFRFQQEVESSGVPTIPSSFQHLQRV